MSAKTVVISVFFILVIALGILFFKLRLFSYDEAGYPTKTNGYSLLDNENKQWRIETLQPKVIGYKKEADKNFLKIVYKDKGKWKISRVFVSQSTGGGALGKISYVENGNSSLVDFAQIKKLVKIGQRVQIRYLASYPSSWKEEDEDICQKFHPICQYPHLDEKEKIEFKAVTVIKELEGNE